MCENMIKMAIMGAGSIAHIMADTITRMEDVCPYAVTARDLERAKTFAQKYTFVMAYGSYEEMVSDPQVDLVYIATPHSHHYKCAKMALEAGKHVLCEKSFTVNASQAEKLFELAREKGLLITEAIWTRYMPSRQLIDDLMESGIIGEVKTVWANLGYELSDIKRIHDPALAGGALLDVGVYTINFARMILGTDMESIESSVIFEDGVDIAETITMKYPKGRMAALQSAVNAAQNRMGVITGTKGYIEIQNINNPEAVRVYDIDHKLIKKVDIPEQITGYEYEVLSCMRAMNDGVLECPEMPHAETIEIMKIMDNLRESWSYDIPEV